MIDKNLVYQAVEDKIAGTDYFIVDVKVASDNTITVEIDCAQGVDVDFCTTVLRHIESVFDREVEDYALEVGSAGLTSPFKVLNQYKKNIGNEVEVLLKTGKKLQGLLTDANENNFCVAIEKKEKPEGAKRKITVTENITLTYEEIKYTKYIIRFK
ncbi:MAG: ribosome assembly cofactor RimP [Paludibacteraceae bacterium]|nr:ribosome assembly cofactor RimP [Paludibacteraceae bacterium]MBN2787899.1 ribosome assembly cofactor RimP [Paludibacteraceae bacterium]